MRNVFLFGGLMLFLAACSDAKTENYKPKGNDDRRLEERGKLTGEGGLVLGGGGEEEKAASGSPLNVNAFLWRATLDTLSFMPLASADPFGGTILTDWYEDPKSPGERFKVNAIILDKTLRADGIKISVFKQRMVDRNWRDQKVDDKLARSLEDAVLTRARHLKIRQGR